MLWCKEFEGEALVVTESSAEVPAGNFAEEEEEGRPLSIASTGGSLEDRRVIGR